MTEIFGIPVAVILGQLMLGLVNGSFYAMLSLGLAVIFGLMGVVNFAHGAFYALGAFAALLSLQHLGVNYWAALVLSPLLVGLFGIAAERLLLRHIYRLEPLYGLLLTFGMALVIEGLLHQYFGASGQSYPVPAALRGVFNLGFMILPIYRAWVILVSVVVCF
jgi:branched-chain amino acid transport system permease protein